MSEVIWTERALANLDAIRVYLEQFNPGAARTLANELIAAGNSLALFPHRNRLVPKTSMREFATAHPYIIRYRIDGEIVVILRVRHTSRRPTDP